MMRIISGDLDDPRVVALLDIHVTTARAATVHGSAHALDLDEMRTPDIQVWTIWEDETLAGVGALKQLSPSHGEVKSMHTARALRGRGAGSRMLENIIGTARAAGLLRLSLETGSRPYFIPARALYRKYGFTDCAPFADYVLDPNSTYLALDLTDA